MRSEHLVPLMARDTVFGPDWALAMVREAYRHEEFGPENFITRTVVLNTLLAARLRISFDREYPPQDRRSDKVAPQKEWQERWGHLG